jgi:anti-anti-sigma factor
MEITISQSTMKVPVTIVRAEGVFDANSVEQFMEPTRDAIDGGAYNILIDLSKVSFMSSIGIRIINVLYYQLHPKGTEEQEKAVADSIKAGTYQAQHLKILSPSENVYKVLIMAGIDRYIGIFEQEEGALLAFAN